MRIFHCKLARRSNCIDITGTTSWPRCSSCSDFSQNYKKSKFILIHFVNSRHVLLNNSSRREIMTKTFNILILRAFHLSFRWYNCKVIVRRFFYRLTGRAAVYGMAQKIPDRSLVADLGANFLDILYSTKPGV